MELIATLGRAVGFSGPVLVASFHPELSDDLRIHRRFLEEI